jgi:hypothetical protein
LAARIALGTTLALAASFGCSVDEAGLAATNEKLQRDGGGTGGLVIVGSGGDVGSGGNLGSGGAVLGSGGNLGDGGTAATGGVSGTGGMVAVGTGGASASGGSPGTGGVAGAMGTGGATETGGTTGTGGILGTGGAAATGGTPGTGGALATGGTPGTGGTAGMGGAPGTGGKGTGGNPGTGGSAIKCGPTNCTGCCGADGQCVHTVTASQCGKSGAACVACAPCEICSSSGLSGASCAIDPTSQWAIVAVSGQVTTSPPSGSNWDPLHGDEGGTAPDLFCEYENPSGSVSSTTAGVTDTLTDLFTADWNQTITPPGVTVSASALMASKPAWRIWVGDEDCSMGRCGTAGQIACSYQQPISAASLMSGSTTIRNYQNCVALTLSFVCQAP